MSIHPAATFLYRLVLRGTEAPWRLIATLAPIVSTGDDEFDARLVGHSPAVDIWGDRIALIARHRRLAATAAAFMTIDPHITRHFQGGDVLWLVRTGAAGLGASVVRNERLVLAVGAVTALPLGDNVQIVSVGEEIDPMKASFTSELSIDEIFNREAPEETGAPLPPFDESECRIRITVSGQEYLFDSGDTSKVGPYDVLVERGYIPGFLGTDACVALSIEEAFPIEAAVRWARLLDDKHNSLTMVSWGDEGQ
jgi:hypothetical protein